MCGTTGFHLKCEVHRTIEILKKNVRYNWISNESPHPKMCGTTGFPTLSMKNVRYNWNHKISKKIHSPKCEVPLDFARKMCSPTWIAEEHLHPKPPRPADPGRKTTPTAGKIHNQNRLM